MLYEEIVEEVRVRDPFHGGVGLALRILCERIDAAGVLTPREPDVHTFGFAEAMHYVADGARVRRTDRAHLPNNKSTVYLQPRCKPAQLRLVDGCTWVPYVPSREDILATDWIVVEGD